MRRSTKAALWILLYFALVLAPLLILLVGPRPAGREFWREFAVALGFGGFALMGLQFIPTARLPFLSNLFPLDMIYYVHHQLSLLSLALIVAHPLILIINNTYTLRLLDITTAPARAQAAVGAAVAAILLVLSSTLRTQLKIKYEVWRLAHALLALIAGGLGLYHMFKVANYSANPSQQMLWTVLAAVWAAMILYVRLVKPLALARKPYVVRELVQERGDSWTLVLEADGHEGLRFKAGQIAWITTQKLPFAIREHPFSFSSSAEHPGRLGFTIRDLGDFTSTVKDIPVGQRVFIDGPFGTFGIGCIDSAGCVFLAGGVGIAPIMSMLRTLADRGDKRPLLLLYGSYDWDSIIFREELDELGERLDLRLVHVLESAPDDWAGDTGYITPGILARYLPEDRSSSSYLICGPTPMIEAMEKALAEVGVPMSQVRSEQYDMA